MTPHVFIIAALSAWALPVETLFGSAYEFEFLFDPSSSGFAASLDLTARTSGTLIGDYDPISNPAGTRTKPGLRGRFGGTENVAVPAGLTFRINVQPQSSTSGLFRLTANTSNNTAWLDGLLAELLNAGPVITDAAIAFQHGNFRTRNPSSIYPAGRPRRLPRGEAQITSLTVTQQGGSLLGTLTPLGPDQYQFAFLVPAVLSMTATFMGLPVTVPDMPITMPFGGQLTMYGSTARITSVQTLHAAGAGSPGTALPQPAMDVPTVLPAGNTASFLFDLNLSRVSSNVDGTVTTVADGMMIPLPATLVLLTVGIPLLLLRRRSVT